MISPDRMKKIAEGEEEIMGKQKKITNFDKIKAMNVDEMAEAIELLRMSDCGVSQSEYDNGCIFCIISKLCRVSNSKLKLKQWLESESE